MISLDIEIEVDGKKIVTNKFVKKILTSMIASAVSNLQKEKADPDKKEEIGEDWKEISIAINR